MVESLAHELLKNVEIFYFKKHHDASFHDHFHIIFVS